jgi:hypothetical protein
MNPDPLAQMKDIIVPSFQASHWPLALGYWLLIAALMLALIAGIFWYRQRRTHQKAMRYALVELKTIDANEIQKAHALLKRVAIHYHGRETYAALSGQAWLNALKAWSAPEHHATLEHFFSCRYQAANAATTMPIGQNQLHQLLQHIIRRCCTSKGVTCA